MFLLLGSIAWKRERLLFFFCQSSLLLGIYSNQFFSTALFIRLCSVCYCFHTAIRAESTTLRPILRLYVCTYCLHFKEMIGVLTICFHVVDFPIDNFQNTLKLNRNELNESAQRMNLKLTMEQLISKIRFFRVLFNSFYVFDCREMGCAWSACKHTIPINVNKNRWQTIR